MENEHKNARRDKFDAVAPQDFLERMKSFELNGCYPHLDFGTYDAASGYLTRAHGLIIALATAQEEPEFNSLNETIKAAALQGIQTLLELAIFNLRYSGRAL